MKYIETNLLQDEKLVYSVGPHWIIFSSACWAIFFALFVWLFAPAELDARIYGVFTLQFIAGAMLFIVGAYWLVRAYIYYKTSEYGVTNKRVVIKVGWIERKSLELLLDKVEGVLVDQTIFGRIFDYGTITIIGTGGTNDRFPYIPDPLLFRKTVQQEIELYEDNMHK